MNMLITENLLSQVIGGVFLYDIFKERINKTGAWKRVVGEVDDPSRAMHLINFNMFYSCLFYLVSNTVGYVHRETIRNIASEIVHKDFVDCNQHALEKLVDKFLLNQDFKVNFRTYGDIARSIDLNYVKFLSNNDELKKVQDLLSIRRFVGFSILYLGDKAEYIREFTDRVEIMSLFVDMDFLEEQLRKCYKDATNSAINPNEDSSVIDIIQKISHTADKITAMIKEMGSQSINEEMKSKFEMAQ